jgi:hypothetical protein
LATREELMKKIISIENLLKREIVPNEGTVSETEAVGEVEITMTDDSINGIDSEHYVIFTHKSKPGKPIMFMKQTLTMLGMKTEMPVQLNPVVITDMLLTIKGRLARQLDHITMEQMMRVQKSVEDTDEK